MIYILIIVILIIILLLPLNVKIRINLDYFEFIIFNIKIYHRNYKDIKDFKSERRSIKFIKIFKIIDIQKVDLEIGGFNNYYYRSINYGLIHALINLFSFVIQDQFKFNYFLDYNSNPKLNFECIIKSNLGKIILGLIKKDGGILWRNIRLMIY